MSDLDRLRFERLVVDISARLRAACAHLPDEEFRQLVLAIAHKKLKFNALDDAAFAGELGTLVPGPVSLPPEKSR